MERVSVLPAKPKRKKRLLRVAGLFAGIGGIEHGLHLAGHKTELLCELEETARAVLGHHFRNVTIASDIRDLHLLPPVDLVTAGFPCQDLSQAGKTAGIGGTQSGLVEEVFRLIEHADIRWLLLENVPFMLQLDKGKAMRFLRDTQADLFSTLPPDSTQGAPIAFETLNAMQKRDLEVQIAFRPT